MVNRKPVVSTVIFLYSAIGLGCSIVRVFWFLHEGLLTRAQTYVYTILLLCFLISVTVIYLNEFIKQFRISLAVQLLIAIALNSYLQDHLLEQLLLVTMMLFEIAIYEKWPKNSIFSAATIGIIFLSMIASQFLFGHEIDYDNFVISFGMSVISSVTIIAMVHYREKLVESEHDNGRLHEALKQLTKTNLEYQDYAIDIEESATEHERNRITRDIHDVVGYTLTNTIMMMEAATDMMKRNPIGVASLINTARENAQEGLEATRRALYKLREKQNERLTGMAAILRMIKLFSTATGVDVKVLWNNVPWYFDDIRDHIIFHTIQQGLINAFIHGKANQVTIKGNLADNYLTVTLKDNGKGIGEDPLQEGIGLSGLRERLEKVDGSYSVKNLIDGFLLETIIPLHVPERAD